MRRLMLGFLLAALVVQIDGSAVAAPPPSGGSLHADFDGDGFADLAVSAVFDDVGTVADAGVVNVIYCSAAGITGAGNQVWSQDSPGIRDAAEASDNLGYTLAAADFDGDGFADLAIGAAFEDLGTVTDAGAVNVIYGSAAGLAAAGNQLWAQGSPGILDDPEGGDAFGATLFSGDFDGDGFADLAVGVPFEDVGTVTDAGAVNVIYGSAAGLAAAGNQLWSQDSPGIGDAAEASDNVGNFLEVGDFNADGFSDLVAASTGEDVGTVGDAGAANVIYGSAAGLAGAGNQVWSQDSPGILEQAEEADFFGFGLAAGDFNGDGATDLSVTVANEDLAAGPDVGVVNVIYGSAAGLTNAGDQVWSQDTAGILDEAEDGDLFGLYSGAGDFNGDGFADLGAASFGEDVGTAADAGSVNVIYGSAAGLAGAGNQFWTQDSPGIRDTAEAADNFGCYVAPGDFDGDGFEDVSICVQTEDLGAMDMGAVSVIYGSAAGLAAAGNQLISQDTPGIGDAGETGDFFGWWIS